MARLRHTVEVVPVPRTWFEHTVAIGWDALDQRFSGPGTNYASADGTLQAAVDAWHRHTDTEGRIKVTDEHGTSTCRVLLRSAAAPRTLDLEGGTGTGRRMSAFTGRLHADFERWWAAAARAGGRPAVEGRMRHTVGLARFTVTPAPAPGGRWRIEVVVRLRGRHVFRPFAALALFFARTPVRRQFAAGMTTFAERWNKQMPNLLAMPQERLRELIAKELR
ncbi:MAG: hypothetical protein WBA97_30775 [Actinophytocola sp.]|uniref:hypothetical protein n=1 Tax=Actinophytocola sp. TaxID=1872138 RepID=UPI003C7963B3